MELGHEAFHAWPTNIRTHPFSLKARMVVCQMVFELHRHETSKMRRTNRSFFFNNEAQDQSD